MNEITRNVNDWLNEVGYLKRCMLKPGNFIWAWFSKYDDSLIAPADGTEFMQFLADRNVTHCLQHGVGYSPTNKQWYGWSQIAIYGFAIDGFTIGSKVVKGDCAYKPDNLDNFVSSSLDFWHSSYHVYTKLRSISPTEIVIEWLYNDSVPNKSLRGTIDCVQIDIPEKWGRGEWIAETMEDAREMAIAFAEGVA